MPQTKAQLRDELEAVKRELEEVRASARRELAASAKKAQEAEKKLREELKAEQQETQRELTEATTELATMQDKVEELETARRAEGTLTLEDERQLSSAEVGTLINELEDAREEALETVDRYQWELDKLKREHESELLHTKLGLKEELDKKYQRDVKTRDELIDLLRANLSTKVTKEPASGDNDPERGVRSSGGGSVDHEGLDESGRGNRLRLPSLPKYSGDDREDVDSLRRWLAKLEKHAELLGWTEREKLVQFELHLTGRAERVYEVLPSKSKETYAVATEALRKRLNPVEREALVSAQLMRRKQQAGESVDEFAQELEKLFDQSYGRRSGMDEASKEMLKRDFFVQGLQLKWQEKVLPSAETFSAALHQARAAEQQEEQLSKIHPSGRAMRPAGSTTPSAPRLSTPVPSRERTDVTGRRSRRPGTCYECGGSDHKWRDCPKLKPTSETPGRRSNTRVTTTSSNITSSQGSSESLDDACHRLQQQWMDAEFRRLVETYDGSAGVDTVAGAVGPLYYCNVNIAGEPVEAMVDTGSSATIMSFDLFKKIGRKAGIAKNALSQPDVTLRDYSQRPIPVGAKVDLEVEFNGKKMTATVYLRGSGSTESESLLLGTNVVIPVGLMSPAKGVSSRGGATAKVRLVQAKRVPGGKGAIVEAQVDGLHPCGSPLLFQPCPKVSGSIGVTMEDTILIPDEDRRVYVPVSNQTREPVMLQSGLSLGRLEEFDVAPATDANELEGVCVAKVCVEPDSVDAARKKKLASMLGADQPESADAKQMIIQAALEFSDVFAVDDEHGEVKGVEHQIVTGDSQPIRQVPRRVPFALRGEISRMVHEMLDANVIEESASPWASPVVLVRKKDGTLRFCVDYRRLNAVTRKDTFPLPRIDDLLDQLHGKKVFSTLDAKRGYWQIKVHDDSKSKTAFVTFDGLYEFRVMPFGLCNAPSTFQRLMQKILSGMSEFCTAYIDDILVFSDSVEEHIEHLKRVFRRLRECGLKLHPRKCSLGRPSVPYLGHVVSEEGIFPDPGKLAAVKCFPTPTDVRALREFLGLASYYRRFVPNFAKVAGPLHMLTHADAQYVWTQSCESAFARLKELLTSPPVLAYPDFSKPFVLHTDASGKGLGAVLEQVQTDGTSHPIAYASRTLSKHEAKYGITELEALAVVWALRHFRAYLLGHSCTVFTDHAPVKSLLNSRHPSGKLARWAQTVAEFDLELKYKPGRKNANADALSRSPLDDPVMKPSESIFHSVQVGAVTLAESEDCQVPCELVKLQSQDPELGPIVTCLKTGSLPEENNLSRRVVLEQSKYTLVDEILYRLDDTRKDRLRICVPSKLRENLMQEAHAGKFSGHFSPKGVYSMLARRYWWNGMYRDVHSFCKSCLDCASYQGSGRKVKPELMPIPVGGPFYRVGVDIMELPQTVNGNKYVISFVDYFTKWVESFPSDNQASETIVKLLVDHVICRHGVSEALISDRGANLLSTLMAEVDEVMGMRKINTTAYHPQADGLVENFNRTLQAMIAKSVDKFGMNWDEHLPHLLFAYRTKPHESTGESPFYLLYGRDARVPTEAALSTVRTEYQVDIDDYKSELVYGLSESWKIAREQIKKAQKRQKRQYDRRARPKDIRVGDRVMVYMPYERTGKNRKLSRPYFSPYRVEEVHPNGVTVRPVDRPSHDTIRVNQDRVTLCPKELPDKAWLGKRFANKRARKN